jgi:8-oxo-dGTP pyrophosphatase MutT (NUDIX family)
MQHRISTGVLLFKNNKILLVKHVHPKTGFTWWVPPGGGLHEDESVFKAGEREVFEETGLKAKINKIAYVRQYLDYEFQKNQFNIYLIGKIKKGKLTTKHVRGHGLDEHYIKEVKFFSKNEMKKLKVFPEILKNKMWNDFRKGFPNIKFIGVDSDRR